VVDKSGTLTEGKPKLTDVVAIDTFMIKLGIIDFRMPWNKQLN